MDVEVRERPDTAAARTPARRSPVSRLAAAMPAAVMAGLAFLIVKVSAEPVSNPDTFFHLRFGQEFLHGWSIWHPGSVTRFATAHWVPTQWLSEMAMAGLENVAGLPAIAWLRGAMFLIYAAVIWLNCRRLSGAWPAAAATVLGVLASSDGLSARPQVVSYVLVVVVAEAWRRTANDGRPRWWLLVVAWVWPMLHGMWPLGLVVSAVAAVGIVVDRRRSMPTAERRRLLALPPLMAVVSALTPVGPAIYPAVLAVGARGSNYSEWGPPDFHRMPEVALLALLATVAVLRIRAGSRAWYPTLMLLLAAGFAVYSLRTVPIAAALLAPMAAEAVGDLTGREPRTRRRDTRVTLGILAAGLALLAVIVPATSAHAARSPRWLDQEMSALPAGTGVLNVDALGGYLMWRYPHAQVYAHGYGDAYTDAELAGYHQIFDLQPGWREALHRTGLTHAVLDGESPLADALIHDQGWRALHRGGGLVWLVAPSG